MADSDKSLYTLRYNQITSNLEAFGGGAPQWTLITLNNVDPQQVPVTRQINTTAPLVGGGNLTSDRTLSIPAATNSVNGYLLATDWVTFNNKLSTVLTSANIFVGNGSNVAAGVPLSGDAALANTGALTLNAVNGNVGSFTNANITVDAKGRITAASSNTSDLTQLTGDVTAGPGGGSQVATLATVNGNVGTFTNSTITVNAKGLITAASSGTAPVTSVSGTAGDISSTGGTTPILDLVNTAVTPGTYTLATVTVDAKGRITAASNGSDTDNFVTSVSGTASHISSTGGTTPVIDLVNTAVTPGTYTNTTLTVDATGRLTAASSGTAPVTSVSGTTNQITSTGGTTPVLAIANPLTLPGTMTAGGSIAMASNKITGLANGTAATDAAAFGQIPTIANGTFTPVVTGCGTIANASGFYQQIGNMVHVWGTYQNGTVTASTWSLAVPIGSITYTNRLPTNGSQHLGLMFKINGNNTQFATAGANVILFADGSTTTTIFGTFISGTGGSAPWPKQNGNDFGTTNAYMSFDFWYAIA